MGTPTEPHYPRTSTPQPIEPTPITNPSPLNIEETEITQNPQSQSMIKDEAETLYWSSIFILIIAITLAAIAFNTARNATTEKNEIQIATMMFHTKLKVAIKELTPTNCTHKNNTQKQGHKRHTTYETKIDQIKHNIKDIISCITEKANRTWGQQDLDNRTWTTGLGDNRTWTTGLGQQDLDNRTWGQQDLDNRTWTTGLGDNRTWTTGLGDNRTWTTGLGQQDLG